MYLKSCVGVIVAESDSTTLLHTAPIAFPTSLLSGNSAGVPNLCPMSYIMNLDGAPIPTMGTLILGTIENASESLLSDDILLRNIVVSRFFHPSSIVSSTSFVNIACATDVLISSVIRVAACFSVMPNFSLTACTPALEPSGFPAFSSPMYTIRSVGVSDDISMILLDTNPFRSSSMSHNPSAEFITSMRLIGPFPRIPSTTIVSLSFRSERSAPSLRM